jgi:hypothetical protein
VAAAAFCPFISAASEKMFGLEKWTDLSKPRDLAKIFDSVEYTAWFKKVSFLYELNYTLLSMCLNWLKWDMPIKETEYYTKAVSNPVFDLRSAVNPKKSDQCYEFYYPVMYNQVFGSTFVENLSLIDLVFCVGPGAGKIVRDSAIPKMNK